MSRNFQGAILQRKAKKARDLQLKLIQDRVFGALSPAAKKDKTMPQKVKDYCQELFRSPENYSRREVYRRACNKFVPSGKTQTDATE